MKRTTTKKVSPDAILMSDPHLRLDIPICRTEEEFLEAQWGKLQFIKDLQKKHNCIVLCAGDLFHYWKPSPYLLSKTIEHLPDKFHTIYGQHDLPQHNLQLQDKSGIYTLKTALKLILLDGVHYGEEPNEDSGVFFPIADRAVLIWHKMTYQGKPPWPGCVDPKANKLLRKYPEYDLILTGDNHKTFTETYDNRLLVNPGSLMRQDADQGSHRPSIFLYYAITNTVEQVYLPIKSGVVSREHIERNEERSDRIEAFISKLDGGWEAGMSFEKNLEEFFKNNRVRKQTKEIIYEALES